MKKSNGKIEKNGHKIFAYKLLKLQQENKKDNVSFNIDMDILDLENLFGLSLSKIGKILLILSFPETIQKYFKEPNIPYYLSSHILASSLEEKKIIELLEELKNEKISVTKFISLISKKEKSSKDKKERKRFFSFFKRIDKQLTEVLKEIKTTNVKDKEKVREKLGEIVEKLKIIEEEL